MLISKTSDFFLLIFEIGGRIIVKDQTLHLSGGCKHRKIGVHAEIKYMKIIDESQVKVFNQMDEIDDRP